MRYVGARRMTNPLFAARDIDAHRFAVVRRSFEVLSERSQSIVWAFLSTSRTKAAESCGISVRTVDQHFRRFLVAAALDEDVEKEAYLAALVDALTLDRR